MAAETEVKRDLRKALNEILDEMTIAEMEEAVDVFKNLAAKLPLRIERYKKQRKVLEFLHNL